LYVIFISVTVKQWDLDIIVSHKLFDFTIDVLLHRMDILRINKWSKIGRLYLKKYHYYVLVNYVKILLDVVVFLLIHLLLHKNLYMKIIMRYHIELKHVLILIIIPILV